MDGLGSNFFENEAQKLENGGGLLPGGSALKVAAHGTVFVKPIIRVPTKEEMFARFI